MLSIFCSVCFAVLYECSVNYLFYIAFIALRIHLDWNAVLFGKRKCLFSLSGSLYILRSLVRFRISFLFSTRILLSEDFTTHLTKFSVAFQCQCKPSDFRYYLWGKTFSEIQEGQNFSFSISSVWRYSTYTVHTYTSGLLMAHDKELPLSYTPLVCEDDTLVT